MAKVVFKNQSGSESELFPVNIFDKTPSQHPVRLVEKVVDSLDISDLISQYKGGSCSAYHPRMLVKVLFYSYLSNIYSCRKIAKALGENIHFMYLCNIFYHQKTLQRTKFVCIITKINQKEEL